MAGKPIAKSKAKADAAPDQAEAPVRPPVAARLQAWWQGVELVWPPPAKSEPALRAPVAEPEPESNSEPNSASDEAPGEVWSENRRRVAQLIFGSGVLLPGGPDHALDLAKSMGLNAKVTMLLFGAGLGADARAIAKETGAYVSGFEIDPSLVAIAGDLSKTHSLEKKAEIAVFDVNKLRLKKGFYQGALIREFLRRIDHPDKLIEEMGRAMKARAELVVADLFATKSPPGPAAAAWIEAERAPIHLRTLKETEGQLEKRGFSIRVSVDESAQYVSMVTGAFGEFTRTLAQTPAPKELIDEVMKETELWTHRVAAIAAGDVSYHRIAAIRK